ncbi:hypothetical protein [Natrinema gelatinilyticum]|uniref:hypothetical protein n=1 Tax=Natrinema gelatinilyticum TaxID=2961571 RepID=UPI0020C5829D|nr:hypothetical protein [Natrinema gelatinilyticum]
MSDGHQQTPEKDPPLEWGRKVLVGAWRDLKSVYYANSTIWKLLKSAGLLFFGLFLWAGTNLLLSYQPGWGFLYYVMAYGFALLLWGPLTHLLVVPFVIRMRRSGKGGLARFVSRHGSKANLTTFIVIVLILGTFPLGVMTFEFQLPSNGGSDVNPYLDCTRSDETVHCHISDSRGIDRVVVTSGGETLEVIDEPPFDFDVDIGDMRAERGDKQFVVELQDENGDTLRRYNRRAEMIPG